MNEETVTMIIVGVILLVVAIILIRGLFWFKRLVTRPMSKQEQVQTYINAKATQHPDGPGAGLKNKHGWRWLFWLIIAIIIAYLLISGGLLENFFEF